MNKSNVSNYGSIDAKDIGYKEDWRFRWMAANDGEISGFVEKLDGGTIKGSSGWYRTNDPEKAAIQAFKAARRNDLSS